MHDTHVHIELLLEKLGIIADTRSREINEPLSDKGFIETIENEFKEHSFAIQATVSTSNYIFVKRLLKEIDKISLLIGSHPEIVNETFDVQEYITQQKDIYSSIDKDIIVNKEYKDNYSSKIWQQSYANMKRVFPRLGAFKTIGMGEIGLDYFYSDDTFIHNKQIDLLHNLLLIAEENSLSVVFHCRDAFEDLFNILDQHEYIKGRFLVHCFTGEKEDLKKIIDRGGIAGFGGITTFKNAQYLRDAFAYCPEDSFVLETDLPFLAPHPHRGKVCLPHYINKTAETLSTIKYGTY